ncbi:MAG: bifunctional phosphoribosyl-AMP cyclohydrolase/phosphoribosyl-ATP diphosphatase HisIE [Flavobacteriaceae bacterium]|nr:bifunctional phosphoribosyl-AMP cyclohydrolase/phosphoribosyl-ATP diphosphatase HisIE [Flavobacteriaceae bacterium]
MKKNIINFDINQINYSKDVTGLIPAIIQDDETLKVLMLGYMNSEALSQTIKTGQVTFFSRSKQRLWTKGEESGNFLLLKDILLDCDSDSLLIKVNPQGPTCHKGDDTCWNEKNILTYGFLSQLEGIIQSRLIENPKGSYISRLAQKGMNSIAQKVGEEANETIIAAISEGDERLANECADLLFHLLILLKKRNLNFQDIDLVLKKRHHQSIT